MVRIETPPMILKCGNRSDIDRKYGNIGIIHGNTDHDVNLSPYGMAHTVNLFPLSQAVDIWIMAHVFSDLNRDRQSG